MTADELPEALPTPRRCRVCGCTDDRACPGGCWWVDADLCSACAGDFGPDDSDDGPFEDDDGAECGAWFNGQFDYSSCAKAGSEECDWKCPFSAEVQGLPT
jgi:hypothetical protein